MSKRILIIEDEKPLAEEWERSLKFEGYDTQIVTTIPEMLNILDELDFKLVLLDVMLPSFDVSGIIDLKSIEYGRTAGVWLAQKIKEKKPSLPILAVTVVTDPKILNDLRDAGVKRILNKPFAIEELIKAVNLLS